MIMHEYSGGSALTDYHSQSDPFCSIILLLPALHQWAIRRVIGQNSLSIQKYGILNETFVLYIEASYWPDDRWAN